MLSARNGETLREVQLQPVNDDPAFARSFAVLATLVSIARRRREHDAADQSRP